MRPEDEIILARLDRKIAHGHCREAPSFELRPRFAAVNRDKETELSPEEQEIRLNEILLNNMGISPHAFQLLCRDERSPGFPIVGGAKNVGCEIAERVTIKSGVGSASVEIAGLHPAYPGIFGQARNVADNIGPCFSSIA